MSRPGISFALLNSTNYNEWSANMRAHLRRLGCWDVVTGMAPVPLPDPQTAEEWKEYRRYHQQRDSAAGELFLGLEDAQKVHVQSLDDSPQLMWQKLQRVHQQKKPGARFLAYDNLFALRKEGEESLSSLLARAEKCKQDICALRPATFSLPNLDEELTCMALIRSLGPEYNAFVSSLIIQASDVLTLEKLQTAFLNEESQRRSRTADSSVVQLANATMPPSPGALSSICSFCDHAGHTLKDCRKFEAASRKAKETTRQRRTGYDAPRQTAHQADASVRPEYAGRASALASSVPADLAAHMSANWNTDTGATKHMTPHRHWFQTYAPHVVPICLANGTVIFSAGIGSVVFQPATAEGRSLAPVTFCNVLHVPDLANNLLSLFHLAREQRVQISISDSQVRFFRGDALLFTATVNERNTGYLDGTTLSAPEHGNAISTLPADLTLWHRRCAHINVDGLRDVRAKSLVTGMHITSPAAPDPICEPCILGKHRRHDIPRKSTSRAPRLLSLIHSDLKGPLPVATPEGYRYWITFICDASRHYTVAYLRTKDEALAAFKAYKAWAENKLGVSIGALQDDKGGEYISTAFTEFCAAHGIERRHTEPDEPHQNGVAERANRTIHEAITAMLEEAHLPKTFWARAVSAYIHVRNRMPTSSLPGSTPHVAWHGSVPDVSHFRIFGCLAFVHVRKNSRRALDARSTKCVFVGYADGTKAWLFWNPATRRFITSSHAVFDERRFPGNSPTHLAALPLSSAGDPLSDWGGVDMPSDDSDDEDAVPSMRPTTNETLDRTPDTPADLPADETIGDPHSVHGDPAAEEPASDDIRENPPSEFTLNSELT
ncbi:hypothetical protein PsYK624_121760 [Phanerochaete sordida]|uniref:Integrase catalytic domain-containing protein n=1 Tax=Phanerochaete sordida TaxID=48140 RepID=A0A9P3LIC2_9APHY|nr:hypothetical protein PsYK624_121760 [Phanerochaete sordida]